MNIFARGEIRAGIDSVRGAKLRSFWTMVGIIIGVASVITVVAIGEGVKQQVSGQIQHLGKDLITIRPSQLRPGDNDSKSSANLLAGLGVSASLTRKDVATVSHTKGVAATAPLTILTGSAKSNTATYSDGFVIGTTSDLPRLLNQSVAYGAFISTDDNGANVAVLGANAADKLFDEDIPLGRSFNYHGQDFIVTGIFNSFNATPLNQQANFNNAIFIPDDVASSLTKNAAPIYEILAKPTNSNQTPEVAKNIMQSLDATHGGESNLSVSQGNQNISESGSILDLLTRLIAGVATISLVVGGIGIMNVMLVSISERTREIGIRKAVGATNRQILGQFMIEATLLSLMGGLLGIILAFIVDGFVRLATNLHPVITWQVVIIATSVSLLIGIIFGTIPASRAARRDPIDALRAE